MEYVFSKGLGTTVPVQVTFQALGCIFFLSLFKLIYSFRKIHIRKIGSISCPVRIINVCVCSVMSDSLRPHGL